MILTILLYIILIALVGLILIIIFTKPYEWENLHGDD
jgi:hypothetical protein